MLINKNNLSFPDRYDNNTFLLPVWEGKTIYFESILFAENKNGEIDPAQLLYIPRKENFVLVSSGLDRVFEENKDYIIDGGQISLCENTSSPYFKYDEFYPGGKPVWHEGTFFHKRQVFAVYSHDDSWNGYIPEDKSNLLSGVAGKLKSGGKFHILFNGDSVTEGYNSSGMGSDKSKPYTPIWSGMIKEYITNCINPHTTSKNIAVAGTASEWGVGRTIECGLDPVPDLFVIAFGMNDGAGYVPAEKYISNIKSMMNAVKNKNPGCGFILVSTMLPNPHYPGVGGCQKDYLLPLLDLEKSYANTAVADITSVHEYLLTKKRWSDMGGNNINHPNDFLARIYAQVVLRTFGLL